MVLFVGLFFLWFTRRQKSGKIIITVGVVVLTIFSLGFLSNTLLGVLENEHSPLTDLQKLKGVKWIVVLGGGVVSDNRLSANDQISASSLSRLVEGIRIHTNLEGSKLIFSGGAVFDPIPEAKVLADVALSLGVGEENILLESVSKDTEDQAQNIQKFAKLHENERFVLVTSASHMPRAVALFRRFGLRPIAAPTDFQVKRQTGINPLSFSPSSSGLTKMERVFHEYLGLLWAKFKTKYN
jgi:uncharacterized SAM-binding protein YcdF (DUF218 family)